MQFLSHNSADKETARAIGALLLAQNIPVWLDEWEVLAGDSIVHKINMGLQNATGLIALWSARAAASQWVNRELAAAVQRSIQDTSFRIIPIVLDDTPLPPLLSDFRFIDWRADRTNALVEILRGLGFPSADRRSILQAINDLLAELRAYAFAPFSIVACPRCGGERLRQYGATSNRGDSYACIQCEECGWEDGSEV